MSVCKIYFQIRPQPKNLKGTEKHSNILLCDNKVMQKMKAYCLTSFLLNLNNFYFCEIVKVPSSFTLSIKLQKVKHDEQNKEHV